jgi:DNA-binding transcriptional ArsR family regulator
VTPIKSAYILTSQSVSCNLPFVETNRDGWGALSDSSRRAIVECLAERPLAVGELAELLPISRPAVSQHLKVLKEAGAVTEHAEGTRRIYRINPAGVVALRDQLDTFWDRALSGYATVAEVPAHQEEE